jgi:hypothetical protein
MRGFFVQLRIMLCQLFDRFALRKSLYKCINGILTQKELHFAYEMIFTGTNLNRYVTIFGSQYFNTI